MKRTSKADIAFEIVNITFITLLLLSAIYPIYFLFIASVSNPDLVNTGQVIFVPKMLTFEGYRRIFRDMSIMDGYRNSIIYTLCGTALSVTVVMMAAYAMSLKKFSLKKPLMTIFIVIMFFNGGMIPTYIIVKNLNLVNTPWIMMIMGCVDVWSIIIARTYIESNLPAELRESAVMDGCNDFRFFFSILVPLSKAIMVVLILQRAVGMWNDYMTGLIYLRSSGLYPLQLVIQSIIFDVQSKSQILEDVFSNEERLRIAGLVKYCTIIVSSLPLLILYPFMQKYFVQGVVMGSLKG